MSTLDTFTQVLYNELMAIESPGNLGWALVFCFHVCSCIIPRLDMHAASVSTQSASNEWHFREFGTEIVLR